MGDPLPPQLTQSDHDLLIRLDQRVGTVVEEMRLMRDDNGRRLNIVEQNKLDKGDFNEYRVSIEKQFIKFESDLAKRLLEMSNDHDKEMKGLQDSLDGLSKQVSAMARYIFIAIGIGMVVSLILSAVLPSIIGLFVK